MKAESGTSSAFDRCKSLLAEPAGPEAGPGVYVTSLGNAGVYVTDHETGFLIDPFVSRYGMAKVALGLRMPPQRELIARWFGRVVTSGCAAVLVGHSHYDHAMDAPYFAMEAGAPLIGSESTANIGRGAGLPEEQIRVIGNGDGIELGRFRIRFIQGEHGPALFGRIPYPGVIDAPLKPPASSRKYRMGGFFGIVVEHPYGTIVHHGSAGWVEGMYRGVRAEVFMPCLAGRADTVKYFRQVIDLTGAPTIIPIHYDNMFVPVDGPFGFLPGVDFNEFLDTVTATHPRLEVSTLPLGQPVRVLTDSLVF